MQTQRQELSYEELLSQYNELKQDYEKLLHQLINLKNHVYGKRSEKLMFADERQELLFSGEVFQPQEVEEEEVSSYSRKKRGRKSLPEDLPRERIEYEPEEIVCPCCGEKKAKIGEEVTEELDYIPARFVLREHVKIKRACAKCKKGVSTGKLPEGTIVIEGARPGAGLLSHIMLSKYADHIPLHRQEVIFERHGVELARQRMCDWIGIIVERYLLPISQALKKEILKSAYVKADETGLKIQDSDKKGWLWGMLSLEGDVYFEYDPSRSGKVAEELFRISEDKFFAGFVQTDLYAGYNRVFLPEETTRVGCWAHARRKYIETQKTAKRDCNVILKLISELYKIEKKIKGLTSEERFATRQENSKPVIEKLEKYLRNLDQRVLPKSPIKQAVTYTLTQWEALTLFLEHPELDLDNNAIERQIRPIAVGRHNWLFAGSERGAKWAACMFSIIATCRRNKINPWDYLNDILRKVHTTKQADIWTLTPRGWKEATQSNM